VTSGSAPGKVLTLTRPRACRWTRTSRQWGPRPRLGPPQHAAPRGEGPLAPWRQAPGGAAAAAAAARRRGPPSACTRSPCLQAQRSTAAPVGSQGAVSVSPAGLDRTPVASPGLAAAAAAAAAASVAWMDGTTTIAHTHHIGSQKRRTRHPDCVQSIKLCTRMLQAPFPGWRPELQAVGPYPPAAAAPSIHPSIPASRGMGGHAAPAGRRPQRRVRSWHVPTVSISPPSQCRGAGLPPIPQPAAGGRAFGGVPGEGEVVELPPLQAPQQGVHAPHVRVSLPGLPQLALIEAPVCCRRCPGWLRSCRCCCRCCCWV
jgi:hypothetical protein